MTDRGPGTVESRATAEASRIRSVYRERDRSGPRHPAIADAYRRLNRERLAATDALLRAIAPPPDGRVLDVGCGSGHDLAHWIAAGWRRDHLAGTDLVAERLALAGEACPGVDLRLGDGVRIPFDDDAFDAATAVTVFSSILDPEVRRTLFGEMVRVVRPGGLVLVHDFVVRKPTNPDVVAMTPARLRAMAGGRPDGSQRLSPLLQLVAVAGIGHPRLADLAMLLAPRTHRLSYWRLPERA